MIRSPISEVLWRPFMQVSIQQYAAQRFEFRAETAEMWFRGGR